MLSDLFCFLTLGAQGWRIEVKAFPQLTAVGAWRGDGTEHSPDYGGYYTQDEVRKKVPGLQLMHLHAHANVCTMCMWWSLFA